jgi:anti-anti-sigma factor
MADWQVLPVQETDGFSNPSDEVDREMAEKRRRPAPRGNDLSQLEQVLPGQCWSGFGLTLTVSKSDARRANVRLVGDLDLASAKLLTAALEHEVDLGRRYLRLDLSGLGFLDTAGLQALLDAHWMLLGRRGTLILLGLTRHARRLMDLTGTADVLLIATDHVTVPVPVA